MITDKQFNQYIDYIKKLQFDGNDVYIHGRKVVQTYISTDVGREFKSLSYFARNRKIVDETDYLLVIPYQMEWQPNGGTWYTHDYAKKVGKPIIVLWPEVK